MIVYPIKFIYSEKATKFCKMFTFLLTVCTVVKSKVKISQNFVAFSEYMNFIGGNLHSVDISSSTYLPRLVNFHNVFHWAILFEKMWFFFQTRRLGWLGTSLTVPLSHSLSPRTVWLSTEDCRPGRSSMKIVMPRLRLLVLYLATMASSLSEASFGK